LTMMMGRVTHMNIDVRTMMRHLLDALSCVLRRHFPFLDKEALSFP